MNLSETLCALLQSTLQLNGVKLQPDSALLGALPELDSIAVLKLLLAIEQQFGIAIADDEVRAAHFASIATLSAWLEEKLR